MEVMKLGHIGLGLSWIYAWTYAWRYMLECT